jgi:predicted RNase H-like nuclease
MMDDAPVLMKKWRQVSEENGPWEKPRVKWKYVVWWDCVNCVNCVNSLQIRNWMAGATNLEGWRKEIGVAVDRKLLKRHDDVIDVFINCSSVVTRWQYTFTHTQYIEQHKYQPNNTGNN